MPSLVGDRGLVLRVLGWALTRIYHWYYAAVEKKAEECLCVEQSRELFSKIRADLELVMLVSTRE